ncbi:hypothetical protein [Planctomonas sp. JC2975]|uniref:hypothetical protein n=1 Tax=Planctomonas sp. JC2975 TaxID=2729626 RepID=UPI00197BBC20|nr:hypothetical protein [Planctomonas sp. JC2975]
MSLRERVNGVRDRVRGAATSRESLAIGVGATAFVVVGVVALFVFGTSEQPITGPGSLGQFAAIAGAITAVVVFVVTWLLVIRRRLRQRTIVGALIDLVALAIAHTVICLLLWLVLGQIMELSFKGALVYAVPAAMLAGGAAAISGYFVFLSAWGMNGMRLAGVLAVFLVVGAVASMMTASDPHWWQKNLSALGMTDDVSSFAFNLTLIVAGLLVTTIARYSTAALVRIPRRVGVEVVRWTLVALGVLLACVGIFPVDKFFILHNSVACGMVVAYLVITVGLRWFIPELPRSFVALGIVFLVVIVVAAIFFVVGYYNLTAVEMIAAVLIFSWLIVFLRIVSATSNDLETAANTQVAAKEAPTVGRHARADVDLTDLDDPAAALALGDAADTAGAS